jgi:hypothetical protein
VPVSAFRYKHTNMPTEFMNRTWFWLVAMVWSFGLEKTFLAGSNGALCQTFRSVGLKMCPGPQSDIAKYHFGLFFLPVFGQFWTPLKIFKKSKMGALGNFLGGD